MPGISSPAYLDCLVSQMIDSCRRIRYVTLVNNKNHDVTVCDPSSNAFDPIKAAVWHRRNGNIDEAAWLVFLSTHFGKNGRTKWQLLKNVYGALNEQAPWNWNNITGNIADFRNWLRINEVAVKTNANFGNHRKYESINALKYNGTGEAIATYVKWILTVGNHNELFSNKLSTCGNNIRQTFSQLFIEMNAVSRFGRTARFDYLTMLGKLNIAQVEPDSTYMHGATGPYSGAVLLFGSHQSKSTFNIWLDELESHLGLFFGMQVLEDSLCNWQKSPNHYIYFGG